MCLIWVTDASMIENRRSAVSSDAGYPYGSLLVDALALGIVFQDMRGHIVTANPAAQRILGLSLDQMRGVSSVDPRWRAVHADGTPFPGAEHPAMRALALGQPVLDEQMGVFNPECEGYTWINVSAFPVKDRLSAQLLGVHAVFEDITAQMAALQKAQLIETRFQRLFEAMSEGMALHEMVLDAQGQPLDYRILDVNPAFEQQSGLARAAVVGQLASVAYGTTPAPFLLPYANVARTQQPLQFEQYFEPLNRHFLITVFSPGPNQFATVFADISERKQLELSLRESQAFIASVIDSLTENIAVIDASGVIVSVNQAWRRFAAGNGADTTAAVAVGVNYLDICARACLPDGDAADAAALAGIRAVLAGSCGEFTQEYPCHSPTEQRWFELHVVPLLGPDGGAVLIHQNISDRKRAEEALRVSEESYRRQFVDNSAVMLLIDMVDGQIIDANVAAQAFYGYTQAQLQALHISDINTLPAVDMRRLMDKLRFGEGGKFEFQHRLASGQVREVEVSVSKMPFHGRMILHSIVQDITERRKAENLIRESEQHFRTLANGGSLLIWTSGLDKLCDYFNEPWLRFTGRTLQQELGNGWCAGVHPDDFDFCLQTYVAAFEARQPFSMDYRLRHADGSYHWLRDDGNPRYDSQGEFLGYIGFCMDVTERRAAAEQIEHLAFYDSLTQLPNRRLMLDRLGQALINSARRNRHAAVLMMDLDNFKSLNDTLGHDVGDQLLVEVAARLHACIRVGDTVSRLGGDEFVVILEDLDAGGQAALQAESVGDKILLHLSQPYTLHIHQGHEIVRQVSHHLTGSIGITLFSDQSMSADELLKRADTAMYQAKAAGRNALRFFDPEMQAAVSLRARLESELRSAIDQQQFVLHYQPQVDASGCVVGAEALVRWQHPERGLIAPAQFIPVAEETGLIVPLGFWVLETACAQLARWSTQPWLAHLTLAVNVSASQCRLPDFVDQVLLAIGHGDAPAQRLKLELTESLLLVNTHDIIAKMRVLQVAGVKFSLDDFGTGYSSLAYLKRLPLDQLKIDKSFVNDVLTDPNDAAIARTVVALSRSLGLSVIAEGVESEGQRDFLAESGCLVYQGYFFSRPLTIEAFEKYVLNAPATVPA